MPWYAEAFTVLQRCVGSHVCAQVRCHLCAQVHCYLCARVPPSGGLKVFQQRYKIQPFSCPQLVGLVALVCPVSVGQCQLGLSAEEPTVADTIWPPQKLPMGPWPQGAAGVVYV